MGRSHRVKPGRARSKRRALTRAFVLLGLFASAMLLSLTQSRQLSSWLGLIPLFATVRCYKPNPAAFAGALWGMCIWYCLRHTIDTGTAATIPVLCWITVTSSGLTAIASFLHHRHRIGPFYLALACLFFEISLLPLNLGLGLLAAALQGSSFVATCSGLFGFLLVAFAVAYSNAILVSLASHLCVSFENISRRPITSGLILALHHQESTFGFIPQNLLFARPPPVLS